MRTFFVIYCTKLILSWKIRFLQILIAIKSSSIKLWWSMSMIGGKWQGYVYVKENARVLCKDKHYFIHENKVHENKVLSYCEALWGIICKNMIRKMKKFLYTISHLQSLSPNNPSSQPMLFLSNRPEGRYFNEILSKIKRFSFKKVHMNLSSTNMAAIISRPQCTKRSMFMQIIMFITVHLV